MIMTNVIITRATSINLCIYEFMFFSLHSDKSSPVRFADKPIYIMMPYKKQRALIQ